LLFACRAPQHQILAEHLSDRWNPRERDSRDGHGIPVVRQYKRCEEEGVVMGPRVERGHLEVEAFLAAAHEGIPGLYAVQGRKGVDAWPWEVLAGESEQQQRSVR